MKLTVLALEQQFNGPDPDAWKAVLEAFRARYPDIGVTVENVKDPGPYYKRLASLRDAKRLPDLFMLSNERQLGMSLPIKDLRPLLMGREAVFLPAALRREADGAIAFLPLTLNVSQVLYANTALLSRLGLSWPRSFDEFLAQAPVIKAAGLQAISMYLNGWPLTSCLLSTLVERTGGVGWIDRAIGGNGTSFDSSSFIAALEVMRKLSAAKMLSGSLESVDYDAPLRAFTGGGSVYFLEGIWRIPALNDAVVKGSLAEFQLGSFPEITGGAGPAGSASGQVRGWAMNAALSGDKELAAWLWLWFCAGPEGQGLLYGRQGDWGASIDPRDLGYSLDPVFTMKYDFLRDLPPVADAIDLRMDSGYLNNELKDLVAGRKLPDQVGREMETWAKTNLAARKKK